MGRSAGQGSLQLTVMRPHFWFLVKSEHGGPLAFDFCFCCCIWFLSHASLQLSQKTGFTRLEGVPKPNIKREMES